MTNRKRVFSGIQPSGIVHIGNYIGALKNWAAMQASHDCLYCIVDLHAITVPQDPEELRKRILFTAATTLASGIDPEKSTIFVQSDVPEHGELEWILNCFTYYGELQQMTQFKDKSTVRGQGTSAGLFTYPVLMTADILLYDTHAVPVGDDQRQHLELARLVARRMNKMFPGAPVAGGKPQDLFVVPEPFIGEFGARIMGLDDPLTKMSKSASSEYNYISLSDTPDIIRRKIKKAVTDSGTTIEFRQETRPALANLISIYGAFENLHWEQVVSKYAGKGYGDFKKDLAEVVVNGLAPIQQSIHEWLNLRRDELTKILSRGAEKARALATPKMAEVRKRIGLGC